MRCSVFMVFAILVNSLYAQPVFDKKPVERKGFIIGVGAGAGLLSLNTNDTGSTAFSATLPNIQAGYMINKRLALLTLLPGATYKYMAKDRGFEAFIIAAQYWIKDNWWALCGAGLTINAPAFYTVKDPETAEFHSGFPTLTVGTGYEIYHKGKFAADIRYRFFYGQSNLKMMDSGRVFQICL